MPMPVLNALKVCDCDFGAVKQVLLARECLIPPLLLQRIAIILRD